MFRNSVSRVKSLFRKAACPHILKIDRFSALPKSLLRLEALEARDVPATLTISSLGDLFEGGSGGGFRVTRDGSTAQTLYVLVAVPTGTATNGTDHTGLPSYPSYLQIPAGSSYADINLTAVDDTTVEPTETVTVSVAVYGMMGPGPWVAGTINLLDNDTQPVVTVAKVADAAEGGASGSVRFTRDSALFSTLTVSYTVGGTATQGADYGALSGSVAFGIGVSSVDVDVAALADNIVDDGETVAVTVTSGSGYGAGNPSTATVTIADDPPVVSVSALDNAFEGGDNGTFRFTRTGGDTSSALTVTYSVSGTATAGDDYASLSGTVTFDVDQNSMDVSLAPVDDTLVDPNEVVTVALGSSMSYTTGDGTATAMILDDDAPFVAVVSLGDAFEGGANGGFRFTRTGDLSQPLTVFTPLAAPRRPFGPRNHPRRAVRRPRAISA